MHRRDLRQWEIVQQPTLRRAAVCQMQCSLGIYETAGYYNQLHAADISLRLQKGEASCWLMRIFRYLITTALGLQTVALMLQGSVCRYSTDDIALSGHTSRYRKPALILSINVPYAGYASEWLLRCQAICTSRKRKPLLQLATTGDRKCGRHELDWSFGTRHIQAYRVWASITVTATSKQRGNGWRGPKLAITSD